MTRQHRTRVLARPCPPLPPTLHTARLRLRAFTSADADALFALHSNAYVLRAALERGCAR